MSTDPGPTPRGEEVATPRDMLAASLAFHRPLTCEQVAELVAAGLAEPGDFREIEDDGLGPPEVAGHRYVGNAWEADFHHGRPILVERGTAATGYVAELEARFEWTLYLLRGPDRGPLMDEETALRGESPGWAEVFAWAAEADRRMSGLRRRGGPELELAAERLARAREIGSAHGVRLGTMWADPLRIGDESAMARYAIVLGMDGVPGWDGHAIDFHDDQTAAVERVLRTIIGPEWLLGLFDLDRDRYREPLILRSLLTMDGEPRFAMRRILPFAATEGCST